MCLAYVRAVRRSYVRAVRRWLTWFDDGALQSLSIRKVRLSSWGPAIMGPGPWGHEHGRPAKRLLELPKLLRCENFRPLRQWL